MWLDTAGREEIYKYLLEDAWDEGQDATLFWEYVLGAVLAPFQELPPTWVSADYADLERQLELNYSWDEEVDGSELLIYFLGPASVRSREMLDYLPWYYSDSRIMNNIIYADFLSIETLKALFVDVVHQAFARKADAMLDRWEFELGLPLGRMETVAERQDRVVSQLRAHGTATIKRIKEVVESYNKGKVNLVEDFAKQVVVQFVDTRGVPSNIADLKAMVRLVVPAHLALDYEYKYFIWETWDAKNETWDEFDSLNLTWDALEVRA